MDVNRSFDESFKKFEAGITRRRGKELTNQEILIGLTPWAYATNDEQIKKAEATRDILEAKRKEFVEKCLTCLTDEQRKVFIVKFQLHSNHKAILSSKATAAVMGKTRLGKDGRRNIRRHIQEGLRRIRARMTGQLPSMLSVVGGSPVPSSDATTGGG